MKIVALFPLVLLAACDVNNDASNDQLTVEYNQQQIERGAQEAASTARSVAAGVGNVAQSAGRAIENEVGDIDVDVNVSRDRSNAEQSGAAENKQ